MPRNPAIKRVLLIGSGPIIIGQACEFDYSGSQAARSLREEGVEVFLINSNPVTIMTDSFTSDHVFLLPLTTKSIQKILSEHAIDAVLPTMGGQTALNLCMECERLGVWRQYGVQVIGVDTQAIKRAEDREIFRKLMQEIGVNVPKAKTARSLLEGKEIAQEIGYPLVVRPSYTLGGTGGGFVHRKEDFESVLIRGLQASPIHEALVEESIFGWKEYELELLRDANGNLIIICSIENVDPTGVHTGDSVTVAPALTLPDTKYQEMRDAARKIVQAIGSFAGGCNVQFAMHPLTGQITTIEINPRVSRSSALASKATGYPIAKIAAKLAIGYTLDELPNQITQTTSACFEPSLDYIVVKVPRWNFDKFHGANRELGLQMKSVGEVMAIGSTFIEALQKACQSLEIKRNGLGADGKETRKHEVLLHNLEHPSWDRIFQIHDAFLFGIPFKTIQKLTQIDAWFLKQIEASTNFERTISSYTLETIPPEVLLEAKRFGFADRQIAHLLSCLESQVYAKRISMNLERTYRCVDTCAAEFPAQTPYYYSTFGLETEIQRTEKRKVMILGSGPNRIGQGIEFDYCCVHGVLAAKEAGFETIMVNCNPETVSTDFDVADKLYFEPVFWEYIYDIIRREKPDGVIVQLGGQTALKLAEKLNKYGVPILGTSFDSMDIAEDRGRFSELLKSLGIPYPDFGVATRAGDAIAITERIGYPVLVRPSYVLGGQGMRIIINDETLEDHVIDLLKDSPNNHVLIDQYLEGAIEAEADAICDGENVQIIGIMEHIEPAGIHSGDSASVLPPFSLPPEAIADIQAYTIKIARVLQVKGLINVQFVYHQGKILVIEANPRASRTVPFICKAHQQSYVKYATKVMLGTNFVADFEFAPRLSGYAMKIPVFSYHKFPEIQKELGPEMKSTGEEIRFIQDLEDEFFKRCYEERNLFLSR